MKETSNPKQVVEHFLKDLSQPVARSVIDDGLDRVWDRLRSGAAYSAERSENHSARHAIDDLQPLAPQAARYSWMGIAAALLLLVVGGAIPLLLVFPNPVRGVASVTGGDVRLAGASLLTGSWIGIDQTVRTSSLPGTVTLREGSRLEIGPHSELSVAEAADGNKVFLKTGTVIVTATKQKQGHLYVETKDLMVTVVGTVFSVVAETEGSRVSVIEGEVHVQRGQNIETLLPGQQTSTNTVAPLPTLKEEIAWSQSAPELVALFQQSIPTEITTAQAPAAQLGGSLRGTVEDASTRAGIPNALVWLCPGDGTAEAPLGFQFNVSPVLPPRNQIAEIRIEPNAPTPNLQLRYTLNAQSWIAGADSNRRCASALQVLTNDTGKFEFRSVSPGRYIVRASREGYFGAPASDVYPNFASETVTIDRQSSIPEPVLTLIPSGVISGTVRDTSGKPLANTPVWAGPLPAANGQSNWRVTTSRMTDDRGEFRLFGLPPGEYRVAAGTPNSPERRTTVRIGAGGVSQYFANWLPGAGGAVFFFRNGSTLADSTPVTVGMGEEIRGVDIPVSDRPAPPDSPPDIRLNVPPVR